RQDNAARLGANHGLTRVYHTRGRHELRLGPWPFRAARCSLCLVPRLHWARHDWFGRTAAIPDPGQPEASNGKRIGGQVQAARYLFAIEPVPVNVKALDPESQ